MNLISIDGSEDRGVERHVVFGILNFNLSTKVALPMLLLLYDRDLLRVIIFLTESDLSSVIKHYISPEEVVLLFHTKPKGIYCHMD